jgi:O-antigen/teichoic acid export membrane protein
MRSVLINVGHSVVAKVLLMAVQTGTTIILARNLSAHDFGVVGFANMVMALLLRLNSMGLTSAVVQRKSLDDATLKTAASLNILFAVSAFFGAQVAAPLAARLLDCPEAVDVVRVLAFGFLLTPIGFLPTCILNREMHFGKLQTPTVVGALARGVTSVGMALTGFNYWSLVCGSLANSATTNCLLQVLCSNRFRWGIDYRIARELIAQGLPITLSGLMAFVVLNVDNFYIGTISGVVILGYYSLALNWAVFGSTLLQDVIHRVLFPRFSRMQDDLAAMRVAFLRTFRVILFGSALMNFSLLVLAEGFLYHVLGKGTYRWLPACAVLQILCCYGVIRASIETAANPVLALGDSKILFYASAIAAAIEIPLMPLVLRQYGIVAVALLLMAAYAAQCLVIVPYLRHRLGVTFRQIYQIILPVVLSSAVGLGAAFSVPGIDPLHWGHMAIQLGGFLVGFVATHELLTRGAVFSESLSACKALGKPTVSA